MDSLSTQLEFGALLKPQHSNCVDFKLELEDSLEKYTAVQQMFAPSAAVNRVSNPNKCCIQVTRANDSSSDTCGRTIGRTLMCKR